MESQKLGALQRNALARLFGRQDFTPEEVARLDYAYVERLPKIGKKGVAAIRAWLAEHGYDLQHLPDVEATYARKRLQLRLTHAARLLLKHGYHVDPPQGEG